jgi:hypothetical protein
MINRHRRMRSSVACPDAQYRGALFLRTPSQAREVRVGGEFSVARAHADQMIGY